jgi:preprotein translocase subunit SecA
MLKNFVKLVGGDPNKRSVEAYSAVVEQINSLETEYEALSDEALQGKTAEFRERLGQEESLNDIMAEAFAVVREVSKRTLGLRPYDVQLMGAIVLHDGKIAEMRTGEGKTLTSTMPIYLNALEGHGVHLITVNDYLARRDARWMSPVFNFLGLTIGVLQMSQRTEGGKFAFLVNLEKEAAHEDQHQLEMVPREEAYAADITYGTNSEFGFDYLRDNMKMSMAERSQREHHYAIIDEVDNVLIDEARTPLIISGPSHDDAEMYGRIAGIIKRLKSEDYEIDEKDKTAILSEIGEVRIEQLMGVELRDPERPEDITPEQARLLGFVEQAMRAQFLFKRNKDYLVQAGKVVIIDEFTGRLMPGRRWSDGLHQAVEAKEGVRVESENVTYATITIQNYFRMYEKLSGMTGTALTEAEEFDNIYELEVVALPSNVEFNASGENALLEKLQDKDEFGYKYTYYRRLEDLESESYLWKRKDYPDMVYRTVEAKLRATVREIIQVHIIGRPILVGTTSVEKSDMISARLRAEMVKKYLQILLLREVWLEQHDREEDGRMILELQGFVEPLDKLNTNELRNMAKDLGISLNLQSEENIARVLKFLDLEEEHQERLNSVIIGGVSHHVLNARKHTEESQIIAGAGAFGAVTIATNMAGRGVDIKLGGEVAEEILTAVNRILRRAGTEEPYELSLEARLEIVQNVSEDEYGIYGSEIKYFIQSMAEMAKVKELGGLHVIGSERHEARRIDNQLRGRAARQGDPGSSRFFLSLQDDLMRLFGGGQVEALMTRMGMDDAIPLESGIVGRVIEQSQTRVEGSNFDARKHLLEYDDVLNTQRASIYDQRDRIMGKENLTDDVVEMLETEVQERVPAALMDEDGSWKLLAWLEQIQPSLVVNRVLVPSFSYQLMLGNLKEMNLSNKSELRSALLDIAQRALDAEKEHLLRSVDRLLENSEEQMEQLQGERLDSLDTFLEGVRYADETDTRSPAELLTELSGIVRIQLKLSNTELQTLRKNSDDLAEGLQEQIEANLFEQNLNRLIGAVERRLETTLDVDSKDIDLGDWDQVEKLVYKIVNEEFAQRAQKLIGDDGSGAIGRDLDQQLNRIEGEINENHYLNALIAMPQGSEASFDKKSRQRVNKRVNRLNYSYYAASFLQNLSEEEVTERVLTHLQNAQRAVQQIWGIGSWEAIQQGQGVSESVREALSGLLDSDLSAQELDAKSMATLDPEDQRKAIETLGARSLSENYRRLLLGVISELWIDYLTSMEALRISIRLEAYAQRDPLVEYKAKAFEMFQQLFADMRSSMVNRMFTFGPQQAQAQASQSLPAQNAGGQTQSNSAPESPPKTKKKRRRRRRKKKN